jgi:hypothetical protein
MFRIERFFMIFTARLPSGPHPGALFRVRGLGVTASWTPPPGSLDKWVLVREIETGVRCQSDQERRRCLFIHGAHAAFLSKQAALAGGAAGDQPSLHVRRERNSRVGDPFGRRQQRKAGLKSR